MVTRRDLLKHAGAAVVGAAVAVTASARINAPKASKSARQGPTRTHGGLSPRAA